jgi:hypothetical protein
MIPRILSLVRFHWAGILAAALCTLFIVAPLIAFPTYAGNAYRGININHYGTDEDFYLARANDVLGGHGLGQPFLAEGKNLTDPTFYKIEHAVLFPAIALRLEDKVDVVTWYNTTNALGVFMLTLLLYAFAFALSKNRLLAVATAAFVIGGHTLIFYKTLFYDSFNIYGRSIFPYAASIPFFAFVLLLYRATVEKRGWLTALGAGVLFGFLFYDYFYAWTFAAALLGSFFLISLGTQNWRVLKTITGIGIIAATIATPFLISFYHFFASGEGASIAYFLLAEHTRAFVMSVLGLTTLALFGLYVWRKPEDTNNPFLLALILAGWIALEQQMLSGRSIEYGHYYWYFIVPISIIIGIYMVASLIPERTRGWFASFLIVIALINSTGGQYRSFFKTVPEKLHDQSYAGALHALNALPYGVVLAGHGNESFPLLVTSYTKDDLYFTPSALVFHTSPEAVRESLLAYLALNKNSRKDPVAYLKQSLTATTSSPYRNLYQDIEGYASGFDYATYTRKLREKDPGILKERAELFSTLAKEYSDKASSPALLRALLQKSGVRFILWDKNLYPEWDLSPLAPLEKINESGGVTLYALP